MLINVKNAKLLENANSMIAAVAAVSSPSSSSNSTEVASQSNLILRDFAQKPGNEEKNYQILDFYIVTKIENVNKEVALHKEFLTLKKAVGRVYICADGINAQISARKSAIKEYKLFVRLRFPNHNIIFTGEEVNENGFPKLKVKAKNLVPAQVDLSVRGKHLSPQEWLDKLSNPPQNKKKTVILDVRNSYEWDLGHFQGALRPPVQYFHETTAECFGLSEKNKEDTEIMMYCTGGIRCEYFSAYLISKGFNDVYQLEGGVQNYSETIGNAKWDGKLFVFDRRNTAPVGDGSSPVIAKCFHCEKPSEIVRNCCNVRCNKIHFCCDGCWEEKEGCCCVACRDSETVRPYQLFVEREGQQDGRMRYEQGPPPFGEDVNKKKFVKKNEKAKILEEQTI
eukprot:c21979_g1_i1.p1 GENE.c21979_g1_i1~~c21979_g1_i1.p1  ORF type:complete len:395 (+),score=125.77 c21979_g1_i1:88-1272(+)